MTFVVLRQRPKTANTDKTAAPAIDAGFVYSGR